MRTLPFAAALLLATSAAHAQTLVVSQNKCQFDKEDQIRAFADTGWIPVAQELVNEGKLIAAGSAPDRGRLAG
jgi:hypothetical protein